MDPSHDLTPRQTLPLAIQSLTLIAVSPSSSTSALRHDLPSNSALRTVSAVPPWLRLAVISVPPVRNSAAQRLMQRRHRRAAVEEGNVVAGIERRQYRGEIAFMHGDAVIHAGGRDIVARELHMLGIALNGIDGRIRRAGGERQSGIAERRSQFQNAPRVGRPGQRRQERAVIIRIGVAAVLAAMGVGRGANFGEGIGPRLVILLLGSDNSGSRA